MAKQRFTYEKQAMLSVVLAGVGLICTLAGAVFMLQAFHPAEFQVVYSAGTMRMPAIGGALFVGLVSSGVGFLLGLSSAGQRLNKRSRLSWTGFFFSAGVITLALCCAVFFWITRFATMPKVVPGAGG